MSTTHPIITGAPQPPSGLDPPPSRLDINDFVKDTKFFSLYVQALIVIQSKPQNEEFSFFGVGGIHGKPYEKWGGTEPPDGTRFCVHGTEIFPTWHRPYVALLEQLIQKEALIIANDYNDSDWNMAAVRLRQPFWDWGHNSVPPEEIISLRVVKITTPKGVAEVVNPFLQYTFNPIHSSFKSPYNKWNTTLRCPSAQGQSQPGVLTERLKKRQRTWTDEIHFLFSLRNWQSFSHLRTNPGLSFNSLESIHINVHATIGGIAPLGHMGHPNYSGFDPLFWLHHANVDRLVALWAFIYPSEWVSTKGQKSDLLPFWKAETSYWSSQSVRGTDSSLNYTYIDFDHEYHDGHTPTKESMLRHIKRLYPSETLKSSTLSVSQNPEPTSSTIPHSDQTSTIPSIWTVQVRCKHHELGINFSVFIFLGDVPSEPEDWETSPTVAGVFSTFITEDPDECENCRDQNDPVLASFVELNHALLDHFPHRSLSPQLVVPYLESRIHWGILKSDGTVAVIDDLPSLEVKILRVKFSELDDAPFPVPGEPEPYNHITFSRPGGSREA